ncbi:WD40-repeat-containing domain protein [Hysterangium stoloniferum]|nr:WD40-repeat-containing domain protein [Hysterangium stoloniferum]
MIEAGLPVLKREDKGQEHTLLLPNHTAAVVANPTIGHRQLRQVLACPVRRGTVYYTEQCMIMEHNLLRPEVRSRCMLSLGYEPCAFAVTTVPSIPNTILIAVGGPSTPLTLSLHPLSDTTPSDTSRPIWKYDSKQRHDANSLAFIPTHLTDDSWHHTAEFRLVLCSNEHRVEFFDLHLRGNGQNEERMTPCGGFTAETCVNHMSISPNGHTILCAGDTPKAYLIHISRGHLLTFFPLATYALPAPPPSYFTFEVSPAFRSLSCFATSWSSDGSKFAIASQEGQLCVWDIRSSHPIFTYWIPLRWYKNKSNPYDSLFEDGDWWRHGERYSLGSGIRAITFSAGQNGRELLLWTEHTKNLHVIDARTFDLKSHCIIPFPDLTYAYPIPASPVSMYNLLPSSTQVPFPRMHPNRDQQSPESHQGPSESAISFTELPSPPASPSHVPQRRRRRVIHSILNSWSRRSLEEPAYLAAEERDLQNSSVVARTGVSSSVDDSASRPPASSAIHTFPPSSLRNDAEDTATNQLRQRPPRSPYLHPPPPIMLPRQFSPPPHRSPSPSRSSSGSVRSPIHASPRLSSVSPSPPSENQTEDTVVMMPQTVVVPGPHSRTVSRSPTPAPENQPEDTVVVPRPRSRAGSHSSWLDQSSSEDEPHHGQQSEMRSVEVDMDIYGLCLDPTGGWVYVAGREGIVEWRVREREEGKGGGEGGWR